MFKGSLILWWMTVQSYQSALGARSSVATERALLLYIASRFFDFYPQHKFPLFVRSRVDGYLICCFRFGSLFKKFMSVTFEVHVYKHNGKKYTVMTNDIKFLFSKLILRLTVLYCIRHVYSLSHY